MKTDDYINNQSLRLFVVLSRAYKSVMDYAKRDIRRNELNPTEFAVLELLYHKGPQSIQKIGDKILLASGSITYVVDKLEQKGLIIRKLCPEDRRVTFAEITEKGYGLMVEIFPNHITAIEKLMSGLDEKEVEIAIRILKKIGKHAQSKK